VYTVILCPIEIIDFRASWRFEFHRRPKDQRIKSHASRFYRQEWDLTPYYFVDLYFDYVKDIPNNIARNLSIEIHNLYMGTTIIELKEEFVYQEIVDTIGKKSGN
jgi:hypothetical protein